MDARNIYTIGHGIDSYTSFFQKLIRYNINVLVDVRRIPYSSYASDYNKEILKEKTQYYSIQYLYMGDTLGSVGFNPEYVQGKYICYDMREQETEFQEAIERLHNGIQKGYSIVMLCAEYDPSSCHRHILLAKVLEKKGVDVYHILKDGNAISALSYSFNQGYLF